MASLQQISAADALEWVNQGVILIDVREEMEWDAGHAPQAIHHPLSTLASHQPDYRGQRLAVICRSGHRSQQAAMLFSSLGCDAYSVDGGMQEWQILGGAVVNDSGAQGYIA